MFQHRMHRHFHHGWEHGPWGSRAGGRGGFGPGRRFGPGSVDFSNPEIRGLIGDVRGLGRYLFQQGASGALNDTEKVRKLRDIVGRTRTEIETLFGPENATTV